MVTKLELANNTVVLKCIELNFQNDLFSKVLSI